MKKLLIAMCLMVCLSFSGGTAHGGAMGQWKVAPGTENWLELGFWPTKMWSSSANDVFLAGMLFPNQNFQESQIFHYDGATWTQMLAGIPYMINGIWGASPTDVYAVGCFSGILHYDGIAWSPLDLGVVFPLTDYTGVWGSSANDIFITGINKSSILTEQRGKE